MKHSFALVVVIGAIAPYSNRIFDAIAKSHELNLHVLACSALEPHRQWAVRPGKNYRLKVLHGLRLHHKLSHLYFNPGILWELAKIRPDAIVVGSFSPTMLLAAIYAFVTKTPLGVSTDGSLATDPGGNSAIHKWIRWVIVPKATFGIGASEASLTLLGTYGLGRKSCEIVPLVSAWDAPASVPNFHERPYDVLFCGLLDESKGASFFVDVLVACKLRGQTLRARVVGDGPLRELLEARCLSAGVIGVFEGYLQPEQLPAVYSSAKLLLFPTRGDAWGLVVNEATLCGTPVICSPHAVSSVELVERYGVGEMLPLKVDLWADTILGVLFEADEPNRWLLWHRNRIPAQQSFSVTRAVGRWGRLLAKLNSSKFPLQSE